MPEIAIKEEQTAWFIFNYSLYTLAVKLNIE